MGGLPQLSVAVQTREGCRRTIEPRFTSILDEGNAGQAKRVRTRTALLRDPWKTVVGQERENRKTKLASRHECRGNLITTTYLDPGSLPSLSSMRPTAFAEWYTCHRSSGDAAVVTGRSVEVAIGVASNVV